MGKKDTGKKEPAKKIQAGEGTKDIWVANTTHQQFMLPIRMANGALQNIFIAPFHQMQIFQCDDAFISYLGMYMDNHDDGTTTTNITFGFNALEGKSLKKAMMTSAEARVRKAQLELNKLSSTTKDDKIKLDGVEVVGIDGDGEDPTMEAIDAINPKDLKA